MFILMLVADFFFFLTFLVPSFSYFSSKANCNRDNCLHMAAPLTPRQFLESENRGVYTVIPVIDGLLLDLPFHLHRLINSFCILHTAEKYVFDIKSSTINLLEEMQRASLTCEKFGVLTVLMLGNQTENQVVFKAMFSNMPEEVYVPKSFDISEQSSVKVDVQFYERKFPGAKDSFWPIHRKEIEAHRYHDASETLLCRKTTEVIDSRKGLDDCSACSNEILTEGTISNLFVIDEDGILTTCPSGHSLVRIGYDRVNNLAFLNMNGSFKNKNSDGDKCDGYSSGSVIGDGLILSGSMARLIISLAREENIHIAHHAPKLSSIQRWRGAFLTSSTKPLVPISRIIFTSSGFNTTCKSSILEGTIGMDGSSILIEKEFDQSTWGLAVARLKLRLHNIFKDASNGIHHHTLFNEENNASKNECGGKQVNHRGDRQPLWWSALGSQFCVNELLYWSSKIE